MARCQAADGVLPWSRCRKWRPTESSSVSTSMRRPLWAKWYQYSSMEPKLASSRSPISRAPLRAVVSFSGSRVPSIEQPVRITSIGWAAAGICSSAVLSPAGQAAQGLELALVGIQFGASAVRRGSADRRSPRTPPCRRNRGCRSRGSAGRCRSAPRCRRRCCRPRRRTGRRTSSTWGCSCSAHAQFLLSGKQTHPVSARRRGNPDSRISSSRVCMHGRRTSRWVPSRRIAW